MFSTSTPRFSDEDPTKSGLFSLFPLLFRLSDGNLKHALFKLFVSKGSFKKYQKSEASWIGGRVDARGY